VNLPGALQHLACALLREGCSANDAAARTTKVFGSF
jgi:hypothetical protein